MHNKVFLLFIMSLSSLALAAQRRVLLEHYTSSWCGECPNAHLIAEQIVADHPDEVILAYHHSSVDPMANPHSTTWKNDFLIPGTPLGIINRSPVSDSGPMYAPANQWAALVEAQLQAPDYLDINIDFPSQETDSGLQFTFSIELMQELPWPGELRLSVLIVEDSVQSAEPGFQQSNYYNEVEGHPLFGMGGSIQNYPFMNVVRDIVEDTWGTTAGLPQSPETGVAYTWAGDFEIADNWDPRHLRLIAVAALHNGEDIRSRPVLDAREINIGQLLSTSVARETGQIPFRVFPNPAREQLQLQFPDDNYQLRLFDAQGRLVNEEQVSGKSCNLVITTLPEGIYLLQLINAAGRAGVQQVVVK